MTTSSSSVSGAGLLLRGPPLSPGVVRGVGTTSRDPLPRAPLSVGASAARPRVGDIGWETGRFAKWGAGPGRARLGPLPARSDPCRARPARPAGPGLPLPGVGPACHSRGPKRPNQQVEERGGPGEEKPGPANRPARARLRHIGRPAHSQPGPDRRVCRVCARRARRGENRPGKSTLGGPGAATFDPAGARRCPCRARTGPARARGPLTHNCTDYI